MKSKQTKYHLLLFGLIGFVIISCENSNSEKEYSEREKEVYEKNDDRIDGNQNRGDEALNPGSYIDAETNDPQVGQNANLTRFIPLTVYNVIRNDTSLRYQEIIDSRPYKKENKVYYEMHFKSDEKVTTVTFDLDGNQTDDYN